MAVLAYRVLSHTADTGIEATAGGISGLLEELATGMFGLMAQVAPCPDDVAVEVEVDAASLEDLVVDVLSDLLYESEANDLLLCKFEATMLAPAHARVTAGGIDMSRLEITGPPIKAVTYHDVAVEQRGEDWWARVYFDV